MEESLQHHRVPTRAQFTNQLLGQGFEMQEAIRSETFPLHSTTTLSILMSQTPHFGDTDHPSSILSSINVEDDDGNTPLHIAAKGSSAEVVEYLVDHGALIQAQNKAGDTPLHFAVEHGRVENVETLLRLGASNKIENGLGFTVQMLVLSALDFDQMDADLGRRLLEALETRKPKICSLQTLSRRALLRKRYGESYASRKHYTLGSTDKELEGLHESFREHLGLT